MPEHLPPTARIVWRAGLTSQGLGGLSAAERRVIVSDRSADGRSDVWRCLDTADGRPLWEVSYAAPGRMDYTNAPRATPVIAGGLVYLLGAFGHLHAVDLATGAIRWRCSLVSRFGGKVPTWGFSGTPLVVNEKVICATGSPSAALAALDRLTGRTVWTAPGSAPAYGSFVVATLGGRRQMVGHDAVSLGGWDIGTGRRLWTLRPPAPRDFNVPTPVAIGGRLLVATENNGTRLYAFGTGGRIVARPAATSMALRPTSPTPTVVDGMVWGGSDNGLYCLDLKAGLRTVWKSEDAPFGDHASLIGGNGHVLVSTKDGRVFLFPAHPGPSMRPESLRVFAPKGPEDDIAVWSHPALVGSRLYLRSNSEVVCVDLSR